MHYTPIGAGWQIRAVAAGDGEMLPLGPSPHLLPGLARGHEQRLDHESRERVRKARKGRATFRAFVH